ncbi:MAG: hypothetical protein JW778_08005 [Candidatus Altiarchaeota archaeon]|nr:hypothetical protein [Candidatus Altiarchaeota archaeon]
MESLSDWSILKEAVEKRRERDEKPKEYEKPKSLILNNTDVLILQRLLVKGGKSLKELREETQRSRVSIYLSIRKLKEFSLVGGENNTVKLKENDIADYLHHLLHEDFSLESIVGERLLVLQSLLDWRSIDQIAVECHISPPSVYKYLKELRPLVDQKHGLFRLKEGRWSLIGFLKTIKDLSESMSKTFQVWSSPEGKLLKTKNSVNGSLTAFSRFNEFDVDYSSEFSYYYVPPKELMIEEIFIHSLKCAEGEEMLSKVCEFYVKNDHRMDLFSVDELALHFDVVDPWLNIQSQIMESVGESKSREEKTTYYYSPENTFLSKSLSSEPCVIVDCEKILKEEKLCWDMLFLEYVKQQRDPNFRWQALIGRLRILEKRSGIRIPILKKLSKAYIENALLKEMREPKTVSQLKNEFSISEYHLRNTLGRMVDDGLIRKIGTKPIKFTR